MEAMCSECNKLYVERKEELFFLIGHCDMICYECAKKYQPERSKREDPHLKLEDVQNMTKEEMKEKMMEMEDTILRQYIQMSSCYICPKCVGCGALNTMET
jgi:hypothetical protein